MGTATGGAPNNLGQGYISNVTSGSNCVFSNTNGGGIQFWDIQSGGTYTVTLSNVVDCDQGQDSSIGVIVHNSTGGNIYVLANQVSVGVYQFTVTLGAQCLTMPIEYCTQKNDAPGNFPGTGFFAQGFNGTGGDGHVGHLRTATFDDSCNETGLDTTCQGVVCNPSSIQVTKFYDTNGGFTDQTGKPPLANWPFCLTSVTDPDFVPVTHYTGTNGTTTFSNLGPGTYIVTEGLGDGTWQNSTNQSTITIDHCGQNATAVFGNFCTVPSGGLTLGFWSNKNGNKIITSDGATSGTGKNLRSDVVTLLNGLCLRNANGTTHTFSATNGYADFRTWLLGANATNMAYMLSAQLVALELDVNYGVPPNKVDGNAFDLCSHFTINALMTDAKNLLCDPNGGYTIAGNPLRGSEQVDKDCMDAINNNGPVIPVTPCSVTFSTFTCP
jgi:hypothetical protein